MLRFAWLIAAFSLAAVSAVGTSPASDSEPSNAPAPPARIDLPAGWVADGIWISRGGTFYVGNNVNGNIYRGDIRTGTGSVLVDNVALDRPGRSAFGIFVDNRNRIFVAGGRTGHAYVYDAATGAQLADYALVTTPNPPAPQPAVAFINDVLVTRDAAYFTNTNGVGSPASASVIFRIPIGRHGELGAAEAIPVPFTGGNGIEAARDGRTLVIASINQHKLFTFDTRTHAVQEIVTSEPVVRGDGLILQGRTLFVAENLPNAAFPARGGDIAVVELAKDLASGVVTAHLNSDADPLVNPAEMDPFGRWIYVIRRDRPAPATTTYYLTRIAAPGEHESDEEGD